MIIKFEGIDAIIKNFNQFERLTTSGISRAMNRANTAGTTISLRAMRKTWVGITARDLKRRTYQDKATKAKLHTRFVITSRSINLAEFGAKQNKKGVSYRLKTKRRTMQGAFTAKGMVFKRKTRERNSIIPFYSITPTSMFIGAGDVEIYTKRYMEIFEKRFKHELSQILK